jgi:DNA primase
LSDFLLSELAARHPPRSAEGRAALVNAAKPLLAQLSAPVFSALLRQRLAELAGLPEREMTALLPHQKPVSATPPVRRGAVSRPAPSLIRGLIQCVLLQPELVRRIGVPKPLGANVDGAALAALVAFCETSKAPLTTAGVMQHFAGGTHEDLFVAALTAAESEGLTAELLETELVEAVNRYWLNARKRGDDAESRRGPPADLSVEEAERARQLQLARDQLGSGT